MTSHSPSVKQCYYHKNSAGPELPLSTGADMDVTYLRGSVSLHKLHVLKVCKDKSEIPSIRKDNVTEINLSREEGDSHFTSANGLFHFQAVLKDHSQQQFDLRYKKIPIHALSCSLITWTAFLCSLSLNTRLLSSLPPFCPPYPVLFFSGKGWNLENSFQWPHQTLKSHVLFFLPVLLLNKELQFEWRKRERT